MKKILLLVSVAFMVSCSNEDVSYNEKQKDNSDNLASRGSHTTQQMHDYLVIGGAEEGWYNEEKGDCSATDTSGCISLDWDIDRDTGTVVEMISSLKLEITNAGAIFGEDMDLADDLFDPIVVDGVISSFFRLEHSYNLIDETDYFKVIRNSDNKLVGVKKFKL